MTNQEKPSPEKIKAAETRVAELQKQLAAEKAQIEADRKALQARGDGGNDDAN
jgi:hypothetical protein